MYCSNCHGLLYGKKTPQASVVQKVDSAIHGINRYPVDSGIVCFSNTYPLDIGLSMDSERYPTFEQPGPGFNRIYLPQYAECAKLLSPHFVSLAPFCVQLFISRK